jgi:hypothetical protein
MSDRALAEETGHPHQLRSLNCTTPFPSALEADEFELWPTVGPAPLSTATPTHHPPMSGLSTPILSSSRPSIIPRQPCRGHIISTFVSTCKLATIVESIMDMHTQLSAGLDPTNDDSLGRRIRFRDELGCKLEDWRREQQAQAGVPLDDVPPLPHMIINESVKNTSFERGRGSI